MFSYGNGIAGRKPRALLRLPDTSTSVDMRIVDLVGKEGVTTMPLRPAGMAIIDGNKVDVVTMGDFIEKDIPVRVVDNSGNRVVVRQMDSRSSKV